MKNITLHLAPSDSDAVIYLASDQPEECCWCGVRTIFEELGNGLQQHQCPSCKWHYLVEVDSAV